MQPRWFLRSLFSLVLCLGLTVLGWPSIALGGTPSSQTTNSEIQSLYRDLDRIFRQAFAATEAGNFAEAEAYWSEAIARSPNNPAAWSNRGNAYLSQMKVEAALTDFTQAIDLAPNLADPYINRGIAWEAQGDWSKALADYDRAIDLNPSDPVAYNNRANAKGGSGDWAGAVADFQTAVNLAPGFAGAAVNQALALYQVGNVQESTRLLKNLVRKYSQFADPRAALTAVLWGQGNRGEAESNWYPVMGLDPRYKDLDWLQSIRRWPPAVVGALGDFLSLR